MQPCQPIFRPVIEFVLMRKDFTPDATGKIKGLDFMTGEIMEDTIAEALSATVEINMDWCNVVARRYTTRHGISVVAINYGYPDGAELFRSNICALSNTTTNFVTFPAADLLKNTPSQSFFTAV